MTLVRLIVFRYARKRQWWWDDFFAFLGILCLATFVPGKYLHLHQARRHELVTECYHHPLLLAAFLMDEGREHIRRPRL